MFEDLEKNIKQNSSEKIVEEKKEAKHHHSFAEVFEHRLEELKGIGIQRAKRKRIFLILLAIFSLIMIVSVSTLVYTTWPDAKTFVLRIYNAKFKNNEGIACTMDAKICPDGSSVGRVAPDCEFAECPEVRREKIDISNWKTYEEKFNDKVLYSIKYPENWNGDEASGDIDFSREDPVEIIQLGMPMGVINGKIDEYIQNNNIKNIQEYLVDNNKLILGSREFSKDQNLVIMEKDGHLLVLNLIYGSESGEKIPLDLVDIFKEMFRTFEYLDLLDISNWQIYSNEDWEIEFKYPNNWGIYETKERVEFTNYLGGIVKIEKGSNPQKVITEEAANKIFEKELIIGSYEANYALYGRGEFTWNQDEYVVAVKFQDGKGDFFVSFTEENKIELILIYKNIISSFKFVKMVDSDEDGLNDVDEAEYGTDPNNPDTDGDSYLDGEEVENGYNPNGSGKL